MSIMEYNGSGIIAMTGKNCVAIASDLRFGIQAQTVSDNMHKIFQMHNQCFIGISGLATDMQTVHNKLRFRTKLYELREERQIKPSVFANMLSGMLYENRFGPFFVEPVVCGLEDAPAPAAAKDEKPKADAKDGKSGKDEKGKGNAAAEDKEKAPKAGEKVPFICAMDLLGAPVYTKDFVVAGTCSEQLYGCCEAFYRPNLGPDELFETISQALLAAVDRDCLAGWGAEVHIITPEKIITKQLKTRKD